MLRVTNNSNIDLQDRFDGVDFEFKKGGTVAINEDVARHIFGFGEPDKLPCLTRLGWMRTNKEYDVAMQILGGFVFSPGDDSTGNDIQQDEQGLAPLQIGSGDNAATSDGVVVESSVPIPTGGKGKGRGRSVLSQLGGG